MAADLRETGIRRWVRHRWMDVQDVRRKLPAEVAARLEAQVRASEAAHAGELCVAIEGGLPVGYLRRGLSARDRALTLFGKLRVWDTPDNNGVLIYLLLADHAIEIVADRGLNDHVPPEVWAGVCARMGEAIGKGDFEGGLTAAIAEVDTLLRRYCPLAQGERKTNVLPDALVML